jgi:ATP-dependent protease ClpP protease subunit|tara:strand:+ start:983 stop:1231 length:249 start_codon:yes stop_codon:yes gene_type:complete
VDIKTITGAVGLVITLGGLLIFQGKLIERVEVLEARQAPDLKPLEQTISGQTKDIQINAAEIKVLKTVIDEMKARSDNPLAR